MTKQATTTTNATAKVKPRPEMPLPKGADFAPDFDIPLTTFEDNISNELPELPIDPSKADSNTIEQAEKPVKEVEEELSEAKKREKEAEELRHKELLVIFDEIMFEGSYEEVVKVGTKYKVTYRSRSAREDSEISKRLDSMQFNTAIAYQNEASLMTLAYSLMQYVSTDLRSLSVKERYAYVTNLPGSVITLLSSQLYDFDQKILEALEYGKLNF